MCFLITNRCFYTNANLPLLGGACRRSNKLVGLRMYVLYAVSGATLEALFAMGTLAVIDCRHIVDKVNCTRRAKPFALAAAYTTPFAHGHYVLAAALGTARHVHRSGHGHAPN